MEEEHNRFLSCHHPSLYSKYRRSSFPYTFLLHLCYLKRKNKKKWWKLRLKHNHRQSQQNKIHLRARWWNWEAARGYAERWANGDNFLWKSAVLKRCCHALEGKYSQLRSKVYLSQVVWHWQFATQTWSLSQGWQGDLKASRVCACNRVPCASEWEAMSRYKSCREISR